MPPPAAQTAAPAAQAPQLRNAAAPSACAAPVRERRLARRHEMKTTTVREALREAMSEEMRAMKRSS